MAFDRRHVLLVQLPIPPPGPGPIRGNVPLAAGYLKLLARNRQDMRRMFALLADHGVVQSWRAAAAAAARSVAA